MIRPNAQRDSNFLAAGEEEGDVAPGVWIVPTPGRSLDVVH